MCQDKVEIKWPLKNIRLVKSDPPPFEHRIVTETVQKKLPRPREPTAEDEREAPIPTNVGEDGVEDEDDEVDYFQHGQESQQPLHHDHSQQDIEGGVQDGEGEMDCSHPEPKPHQPLHHGHTKQDIEHIFRRFAKVLLKKHGAFGPFMSRLSDAFFVSNQDDIRLVRELLAKAGMDEETISALKWSFFKARVRRSVPEPRELEKEFNRVINLFEWEAILRKESLESVQIDFAAHSQGMPF